MRKSIIALLLAIGILLTSLPLNAFAEEEALLAPSPEYEVGDVDGDTGVPGLVLGEDADEAPSEPEAQEVPAPVEDEAEAPEKVPEITAINSAADDPGFIMGYVRVLPGANAVADADGHVLKKNLPEGAVLYAFDRDLEDRIAVCFDTDAGVVEGWMPATALKPLDADETRAFLEGGEAQAAIAWFDNEKTLPLARVSVQDGDTPIDGRPDSADSEESSKPDDADSEESSKPDDADSEESSKPDDADSEKSSKPDDVNSEESSKPDDAVPEEPSEAGSDEAPDTEAPGACDDAAEPEASAGDDPDGEDADGEDEERTAASCDPAFNMELLTIGVKEKTGALRVVRGDMPYEGAVSFATSNAKVVKVNEATGVVTGVKKGVATITATLEDGETLACTVNVLAAPTKVTLTPKSAKVSVGMSFRVVPAVKSGQACNEYKYSSDHPKIASVDADGVVTANAAGSAKITVKTYNGQKVGCKVTVCNAPETIVLSADEITIGVGATASVAATALDARGKSVPSDMTYAFLSGGDCAALDEEGKLVGVAEGVAVIRATDYLGHYADCTVNVLPAPASIEFEDDTPLVLGVGESYRLPAIRALSEAGDDHCAAQLKWASSNAKIVKVDAKGVCKAVKKGSADITVTDQNGLSAIINVTVKAAPSKIKASPAKITMGVGETAQLSYKLSGGVSGRIGWSSNKAVVASVDENGRVEALSAGTATVTLSTFNKKKAKVSITVKEAPEWIALDAEEVEIGVGETRKLSASVNAGAGGRIDWSAGDEVSLDGKGTVKGVAPGETEVTARTYNGCEAACRVTVKPAPEYVSLPYAGKTLYIGVGDTEQLVPDLGGAGGAITYSASNKRIASVSGKGLVKGVKAGTSYVTIKTYNKKSYKLKVVVRKAPGKVTATPANRELGLGESFGVGYILPSGTQGTITFESTDDSVLSVDPVTGEVTAVGQGEARVRVRTHNGKQSYCNVIVRAAPDSIEVDEGFIELGVGQTRAIHATIPEGTCSAITYESLDTDVVKVSASGVITAVGRGTTGVRVGTFVPGVETQVSVTVWDAPAWVKLDETSKVVNVDDTFDLVASIPEGSMSTLVFASSNEKVATVSQDGHVVARQRGTAKISVATYNNQKAVLDLTVYDPWYPEAMILTEKVSVLNVGDEYQVQYEILPETARPNLVWTSSNPKVATVDQQGYIKCVGYGYTSISAVSEKNRAVGIQFTLGVQTNRMTLAIPLRQTDIAGIPANLARIDAVRASAIGEINELYRGGVISKADANKRKTIVNNAFKIYAFPWMTPTKQKYWKAANSEGGVKDFKPGRVYYGLPYISGSYRGRCFNVDKALKEKYYTDSGKGYYLMNQSKKLDGSYVGNDCSGFCNVCIWGTGNAHTDDRTADIGVSSAYKTVSFNDLRPGDLICKRYAHVVMFLYYANPEHTKIMMIENGGAEAGTNTVHCDVYDLSYYKNRGYSVRRLKTLG